MDIILVDTFGFALFLFIGSLIYITWPFILVLIFWPIVIFAFSEFDNNFGGGLNLL